MDKITLATIINLLLEVFGYEIKPIIKELKKAKRNQKNSNSTIQDINPRLLKINKAQIARELGISRSYVTMLMSGERNNPEQLRRIEELLKQELKAA